MSASLLDYKFVLFLCGLGAVRVFWPRQHYVLLGALSSALLVGLASLDTLVVISAIAVLYLYPMHRMMRVAESRNWPESVSRLCLSLSIAGLVALLLLFKIDKHLTIPFLSSARLGEDTLSLVGFSYFIFRAINFLHIQAILKFDERSPWVILFYALFPPTLTSGPIQRYQDFRQQAADPTPLSTTLARAAGYRITRGFFRKVVVAFALNEILSKFLAVESPTALGSAFTVAILYLYFYYDFAGYSDIAIGFGLLLGIRVPENFRRPFTATTISEFWRNWHITLVDWFRDNVFIPLGGMRSSRARAGLIAFFIMVLCGLWHGLTLTFLAWGIWHGGALWIEAIAGIRPIPPGRRSGPRYWARVIWTNACVAIPCVFFLPNSAQTVKVLRGFTNWSVT